MQSILIEEKPAAQIYYKKPFQNSPEAWLSMKRYLYLPAVSKAWYKALDFSREIIA